MPPRSVQLVRNHRWKNNPAENLKQRVGRYYSVWNRGPNGERSWKHGRDGLKWIIQQAEARGERVRAAGRTWSMSPVVPVAENVVNLRPMNTTFSTLRPSSVESYIDPSRFVLVQAGTEVRQLNRILKRRGKSLKTQGGGDGQAIAGAISTGTHGSGLLRGSMADYVRGIHLVTEGGRELFIERETGADAGDPWGGRGPVVRDSFAQALGATPMRNDDLLEAAALGFGSFGLIHSLLLEVDDLFYLKLRRRRRDVDATLKRALTTLDLSPLNLPTGPGELYHFEATINPYAIGRGKGGAYVSTLHRTRAPRVASASSPSPLGDSLGRVLGGLIRAAPASVPTLLGTLLELQLGEVDEVGTLGELFTQGAGGPRFAPISTEIAVHQRHAARALNLIVDVVRRSRPSYFYPGVVAFRYVAQKKTLLGFNRFTQNCTIELPALGAIPGTLEFYGRVWAELARANIPYTLHWGQVNHFNRDVVRAMWGANVDKWIAARRSILSPKGRRMFSNPYLSRCGLSR